MKKPVAIFISLFLMPWLANAGTGTAQLTSYYPAPISNYQMVKLSNTTYSTPSGTYDSSLNTCSSSPCVCNSSNPGMLFADGTGTIYMCKQTNTKYYASIYPQQCYNYFCTGGTQNSPNCLPSTLPQGFQYLKQDGTTTSDVTQAIVDSFPSSTTTNVYSTVLCSY